VSSLIAKQQQENEQIQEKSQQLCQSAISSHIELAQEFSSLVQQKKDARRDLF